MIATNRSRPLVVACALLFWVQGADRSVAAQDQIAPGPREALQQDVADLQTRPTDEALRETIIKLVLTLSPPPALPDDVQRFMARGNAAMEIAKASKSAEDARNAVDEFGRAALAAPWFANAYYNLAMAQSVVEDYAGAIQNLKLYLLAAPDAPDAAEVQTTIFEFEYKADRLAKQRAEEQAQAQAAAVKTRQQQAIFDGLGGPWLCSSNCGSVQLQFVGTRFEATIVSGGREPHQTPYDDRGHPTKNATWRFTGARNDFDVEGTAVGPRVRDDITRCDVPAETHSFVAVISPDGRTITLRTEVNVYSTKGERQLLGTTCTDVRVDHREPQEIVLVKANQWGAIAYSFSTGVAGYAFRAATRQAAEAASLRACKAKDCQVKLTYADSCGAIAADVPGKWAGWAYGASPEAAAAAAMSQCQQHSPNCALTKATCSDGR